MARKEIIPQFTHKESLDIIIVEDDFIIASNLKNMLTSLGHSVPALESSGEDALMSIKMHQPDLLLVDILLKGEVTGIELIKEVSRHLDVPVIYITGYSDYDTLNLAKETNPYGYLLKPITTERLKAAIEIAHSKFVYDQRIKASERIYHGIVENLPFMLCRFLPKNAAITYVNNKYCAHLGRAPHELVGSNFFDIVPIDLRPEIEKAFQSLNNEKPLEIMEFHDTEGESGRWQKIYCQALFLSGTRVFEYQFIVSDISEIRRLEKEILLISERERQTLGTILHDSLGQLLTGISFLVKKVQMTVAGTSESKIKEIDELALLVREAAGQCRYLARGLVPVVIEKDGFMDSLQCIAREVYETFGIRCRVLAEGPLGPRDDTTATHLYYIVRESVNNACKHGEASTIDIAVGHADSHTTITIEDDGKNRAPRGDESAGLGMKIMKYRADLIGAEFSAGKKREGGWRVKLRMAKK